jgi:hypothetical protein
MTATPIFSVAIESKHETREAAESAAAVLRQATPVESVDRVRVIGVTDKEPGLRGQLLSLGRWSVLVEQLDNPIEVNMWADDDAADPIADAWAAHLAAHPEPPTVEEALTALAAR